MAYTEPILRIVRELSKLPGIGEKTAERITFHLLSVPGDDALLLAKAIKDLKEQVKSCSRCYNISERDPCEICSNAKRDAGLVCVVEQSRDLWAIEKSGAYRGSYHVLNGRLSPLDGVGPEHLTIRALIDRLRGGGIREVILATNPTAEGDATAHYLQQAVGPLGVRVTRIARGVPAGGSLEYANRTMVRDAMKDRKEF